MLLYPTDTLNDIVRKISIKNSFIEKNWTRKLLVFISQEKKTNELIH